MLPSEMEGVLVEGGHAAGAARLASSSSGSRPADMGLVSERLGSSSSSGAAAMVADVEVLNRPDGQGDVGQILKWIEMKVSCMACCCSAVLPQGVSDCFMQPPARIARNRPVGMHRDEDMWSAGGAGVKRRDGKRHRRNQLSQVLTSNPPGHACLDSLAGRKLRKSRRLGRAANSG
jgi:hypothetical protein